MLYIKELPGAGGRFRRRYLGKLCHGGVPRADARGVDQGGQVRDVLLGQVLQRRTDGAGVAAAFSSLVSCETSFLSAFFSMRDT